MARRWTYVEWLALSEREDVYEKFPHDAVVVLDGDLVSVVFFTPHLGPNADTLAQALHERGFRRLWWCYSDGSPWLCDCEGDRECARKIFEEVVAMLPKPLLAKVACREVVWVDA